MLDIGPGTSALVLFTQPDLEGAEIDIGPADNPGAARTHSLVRARWATQAGPGGPAADRVSYAAAFPGLAAGTYVIWRDAATPIGSAAITGGEVTEWHWPAAASGG